MGQFIFENLAAYKEAKALTLAIYEITDHFPSTEQFGITNQAQSICFNIIKYCRRQP